MGCVAIAAVVLLVLLSAWSPVAGAAVAGITVIGVIVTAVAMRFRR
jgi:hypothetical protein